MVEWNGDAKEVVKTSFYRENEDGRHPKTLGARKLKKK